MLAGLEQAVLKRSARLVMGSGRYLLIPVLKRVRRTSALRIKGGSRSIARRKLTTTALTPFGWIVGRKMVELMTANHLVTLSNKQASTRHKGYGLGVEVTTDLGRLL